MKKTNEMVQELRIRNFKSHKNTLIKLHPGVNCIVGDSLEGKTNILRGLKLLATNRPLGFRFNSNFDKTNRTKITAKLPEGILISLTKTPKTSTYRIRDSEGKGHKWSKYNKGMPDKVRQSLNISKLNIQGQLDGPFLMTSSPAEIARTINKTIKIDQIDSWIKNINSKISKLRNKTSEQESNLERIKKRLHALRKVGKLEDALNKLERVIKQIGKLESQHIIISDTLNNIAETQKKIKEQENYLKAKKYIKSIEKVEREITKLDKEREVIEKIISTKEKIRSIKKMRDRYEASYIKILRVNKICPTCFHTINRKDIGRITNEIRSH